MPRKHRRTAAAKKGKFTETLEQLVVAIADGYIEEFKDAPEDARRRANVAMGIIQQNAGGSGMYVAKGHFWAITEKHRQIYRRFTGDNHAQLAREFDLTERQIYNAIAAISEEEFQRRQPGLFEQTA